MVNYSEKLFLTLFEAQKKKDKTPDVCVCGSDFIAQEVLKTLHKHGINMHVIADNEISEKSLWLITHEDLAKIGYNGKN